MRMLSKQHLLALTACLPLCVAFAMTPGEVFQANRDSILLGKCAEEDGFLFSVSHAKFRVNTATGRKLAEERSHVNASVGLLAQAAFSQVEWPETLDAATCSILRDWLLYRLNLSATVGGIQTVYSEAEDGQWVTVVAVPSEALADVPRFTFEELRDRLLAPETLSDPYAPLEALLALRATLGPVPEPVDRKPWEALLAEAKFPSDSLNALPRLAGRYPLGIAARPTDDFYTKGNAAFAKKDVRGAYVAYLNSLTRGWSFAALNMAGNCARRLGRNAEAAALLLQAAYLNPESPYPWIHLAFVARAVGNEALCAQCADFAEERAGESAWTQKQLAVLREPPEPVDQQGEAPAPVQDEPEATDEPTAEAAPEEEAEGDAKEAPLPSSSIRFRQAMFRQMMGLPPEPEAEEIPAPEEEPVEAKTSTAPKADVSEALDPASKENGSPTAEETKPQMPSAEPVPDEESTQTPSAKDENESPDAGKGKVPAEETKPQTTTPAKPKPAEEAVQPSLAKDEKTTAETSAPKTAQGKAEETPQAPTEADQKPSKQAPKPKKPKTLSDIIRQEMQK